MAPLAHTHPTLQDRSRRTVDRLLDAAESVLTERGLDAATVPAIARRAGLSVGVVYRRFPDKDELLRAVYERFFDRVFERTRAGLETARRLDLPAPDLVRAILGGMIEGYRLERKILRALLLYWLNHRDPRFRRRARVHNLRSMKLIDELFRPHYRAMGHPRPREALRFVLTLVASAAQLALLAEAETALPFAGAPRGFSAESVRMASRYLGIETSPAVTARRTRRGRAGR